MDYLRKQGLTITALISDRHASIAKHMRTVLKNITHYFDLWHLKKSKYNFILMHLHWQHSLLLPCHHSICRYTVVYEFSIYCNNHNTLYIYMIQYLFTIVRVLPSWIEDFPPTPSTLVRQGI